MALGLHIARGGNAFITVNNKTHFTAVEYWFTKLRSGRFDTIIIMKKLFVTI